MTKNIRPLNRVINKSAVILALSSQRKLFFDIFIFEEFLV